MFAPSYQVFAARIFSCCIVFTLLALFSPLPAQDDAEKEDRAAKTKPKKESPMKGQDRELEGDWFTTQPEASSTNDGIYYSVKLSATYYYGNADKQTVPVLLFHDMKGNRNDFRPLISRLTSAGYAVLAPDFRGHGKSTKRYEAIPPKIEMKEVTKTRPRSSGGGSGRGQKPKTYIEPTVTAPASKKLVDYLVEDFQPEDYRGIISGDLPLLRKTLENVHAEGMINMNRLVVVGIGKGAAIAAYWTLQDYKDRGSDRFTKTLVLIAPGEIDPRADFSKLFEINKWIHEYVSVLCAVPAGDTDALRIANKFRDALMKKDDKDDKDGDDAKAEKGGMESKFPIYSYPTEKTVKSDKGESKATMSMAETFSSGEAKLGQTVLDFINKRNAAFEEREARWTKLK